MSASHLRWALSLTARRVGLSWTTAPRTLQSRREIKNPLTAPPVQIWYNFSTEAGKTTDATAASPPPKKKKEEGGGEEEEEEEKKKKKPKPRELASVGSVGRRIQQRLQLLSEEGESLGSMHRSQAIRLMDERGLKLVLLDGAAEPPVYQLMSGKQILENRLKLREKQKAKQGVVQVKELTFSSDIGSHDLSTKLKQVQTWLDKKNHVRLTLQARRHASSTTPLDQALEEMVQQIPVTVGFVSKPKVVREGRAMCVLRPPSAKELLPPKVKSKVRPPPTGATPQHGEPEAIPASPADVSEDPVKP